MAVPGGIDLDFRPSTAEELEECLSDPVWRICSGTLYQIQAKGAPDPITGEETVAVIPFRPNRAQVRFIKTMWNRNLVLKCRQVGYTTLVCIIWLDHALFVPDQRCAIIAHVESAAINIMRTKVLFAYERLPEELKAALSLVRKSDQELAFSNGSSIQVAVSVRSGTYHRLLVSEYGKICAEAPVRALEVQTGSLPAVPEQGVIIIESTAEGQEGDFYNKTQIAIANHQARKTLNRKEYRFHFAPWWDHPEYKMPLDGIIISQSMAAYFHRTEAKIGRVLTDFERAWYVATMQNEFSGNAPLMWREYPSYPDEAFAASVEGTFYANELASARMQQRIGAIPYMPGIPVNTFWDIGTTDATAIWFHQQVGVQNRFIRYYEANGESYAHFVRYMQEQGYIYGRHFLPHDANRSVQVADKIAKPIEMLSGLMPTYRWEIVPVVSEVIHGIQLVRDQFPSMWFDETNCAEGLKHLGLYRKEWNKRLSAWSSEPRHDAASNCADALRQFAQARTTFFSPSTSGVEKPWRRTSGRTA